MSAKPDTSHIQSRFAEDWEPWISVGDGWLPMVVELHAALVAVAPDIRYRQIKEKDAELRVYTTCDGDPEVRKLTDAAEQRSHTICESCGEAGSLHKSPMSWYRILCEGCAAEQNHTKVPPL